MLPLPTRDAMTLPSLPDHASLADLQSWIDDLERARGWRDADPARCCFLMGEEVGEVFAAVRRAEPHPDTDEARAAVGEELVDVLNYLLAIANRYGIDLETAFREKNAHNLKRTWP